MYTMSQLIYFYTALTGVPPSARDTVVLIALQNQAMVGWLTDQQVLNEMRRIWGPKPAEPTPEPSPDPGLEAPLLPSLPSAPVSSVQALTTFYASIMRSDHASAADAAALGALAAQVSGGGMTLAAAQAAVARMAASTVSVANLTYQFFTGSTPSEAGVDYLISNPNGLASDYYRGLSLEDRYIGFSVNLGKFGAGQARFAAAYGDLSLAQALSKAYAEIFGTAPTDAKVQALLDAQFVIGGRTVTRAQYFAGYGQDGENGIGTKAAMIGWLLAEAIKADIGPYAKAQAAFLADLGPDGLARFRVDLLEAYGVQVASPTGARITVAHGQSVSTSASDAALRSTDGGDVIEVSGGLDAGRTIATGDGDDRVSIEGVVNGRIELGDGDSIVTLEGLGPSGSIVFGGGSNTVNLGGVVAAGATITAAGTNNTLHVTTTSALALGSITGFQTVVLDAPPVAGALTGVKGAQVIYDMVPSTFGKDVKVNIIAINHETVVLKDTSYGVVITDNTVAGAADIVVHLDHFTGAPTTKIDYRNTTPGDASYSANGGSITIFSAGDVDWQTRNGKVTLYVDSDSTAGMVFGYFPIISIGGMALGAIKTLELRGTGKLTAQIFETFTQIDASHGGAFDLAYAVAGGIGIDKLKAAPVGSFKFSDWGGRLSVSLGHTADKDYAGPMTFTLGAGADTIVVAKGARGLNNLAIVDKAVFVTAEVKGFEKGVDHLVLDAVSHGTVVDVQAAVDGAPSLTQALTLAADKVAASGLAVFTYGGDTYVYVQDDVAGLNMGGDGHAGDGLIKLTGVTGLSVVTGAASGDIHWA